MYSLEEIKGIIYPKDEVSMEEVLKDLLKQTVKNGEMLVFDDIYLYSVGDPDRYLHGISLVDDKLIAHTGIAYGGDTDNFEFGIATDKPCKNFEGIHLTKDAIVKVCKAILEDKAELAFNFKTMEGEDSYYFCGKDFAEDLKEGGKIKENLESLLSGKIEYFDY